MLKKIQKHLGRKLLNTYKMNKQKALNSSLEHCLKTIHQMIKKSKYCLLITNSNRSNPSARMVQPVFDEETLELWIGTNPSLRKVEEIQKDPNVTVAFLNEKEHANLIIYGKAYLINDLQERKNHWLSSWIMFFPGGPATDDFISIQIVPEEIELMNFKRNIVPEPFGLNPVQLKKSTQGWQVK